MGPDFTAVRARLAYVPSVARYREPVRRQRGSDKPHPSCCHGVSTPVAEDRCGASSGPTSCTCSLGRRPAASVHEPERGPGDRRAPGQGGNLGALSTQEAGIPLQPHGRFLSPVSSFYQVSGVWGWVGANDSDPG